MKHFTKRLSMRMDSGLGDVTAAAPRAGMSIAALRTGPMAPRVSAAAPRASGAAAKRRATASIMLAIGGAAESSREAKRLG
eukprot:CAMPEP_0171221216 /NCGR_PEP_ID=MMETSP0790-20130122/34642_1 /TAXON_ID=2925 /ORGANISM="Alexandrium catenella, Strain OF101" /LENGTH=80 /DNA_ID=CAMNT_0011687141 /DNA_START=19 /DNA_END=257 /DNA_ORIENTATION=-